MNTLLNQQDLQNLSEESLQSLRNALTLAGTELDRLSADSRNRLQALEDQLSSEANRRFWANNTNL
jgi:hypothetical protein